MEVGEREREIDERGKLGEQSSAHVEVATLHHSFSYRYLAGRSSHACISPINYPK